MTGEADQGAGKAYSSGASKWHYEISNSSWGWRKGWQPRPWVSSHGCRENWVDLGLQKSETEWVTECRVRGRSQRTNSRPPGSGGSVYPPKDKKLWIQGWRGWGLGFSMQMWQLKCLAELSLLGGTFQVTVGHTVLSLKARYLRYQNINKDVSAKITDNLLIDPFLSGKWLAFFYSFYKTWNFFIYEYRPLEQEKYLK